MKQSNKSWLLWPLLVLMVLLVVNVMSRVPGNVEQIDYSAFRNYVRSGVVAKVEVKGQEILGSFQSEASADRLPANLVGKKFQTVTVGTGDELIKFLESNNITAFTVAPIEKAPLWQSFMITWLPFIILILVFLFVMRQLQAGGGKALSFGKSRARMLNESQTKVTFKDVAGVQEAKEELEEIIEFLKDPKKFTRLGGRIPKGVLLVGPPGTGKTLLAKAIAGEAGAPFFTISGSDFVEMFVGVGASRVRDLFEQGKKHAPCIIFIDEIDAVGRQRGAGWGGGHDEREQTLNQLLVEMDGFESKDGVILIAATNRPDVLDPALLRPGRFDRRVVVPLPDVKGRLGILEVHGRRIPMSTDVDLEVVARGTPGFSGADLANMINEAALVAARFDKNEVEASDIDLAKDKVLMGAERRSMVISDDEKRNTAYHEAGHALVAKLLPGTDPVHKVTIIPRGMALGVTQLLPKEEKYTFSQEFAENQIAYIMGGRVAEEVFFDHRTTGAGDDLKRATEMARKMVCQWGMSEKIGPMVVGKHEGPVFLGKDYAEVKDYSEQLAQTVDQEVRSILERNYDRAHTLIAGNCEKLEALAEALLEYESLEAQEIDTVLAGKKLQRKPVVKETAKNDERAGGEPDESESRATQKTSFDMEPSTT